MGELPSRSHAMTAGCLAGSLYLNSQIASPPARKDDSEKINRKESNNIGGEHPKQLKGWLRKNKMKKKEII